MAVYNNDGASNWKLGDGGYILIRNAGILSDTTDGLQGVVSVKVPYNSKLKVTSGGNGGGEQNFAVKAQIGLGTDNATAKTVVTVNGKGNDSYTSTEDEYFEAQAGDVVYIYAESTSKFRSVTFIKDESAVGDPTPTAEPTATPTAEPTATPTAEPTEAPTATPTALPTLPPNVYEFEAGTVVAVNATPDTEGQVAQIVVKGADGTDITVTDNTFVMPEQDVTVDVTFAEPVATEAPTATATSEPQPTATAEPQPTATSEATGYVTNAVYFAEEFAPGTAELADWQTWIITDADYTAAYEALGKPFGELSDFATRYTKYYTPSEDNIEDMTFTVSEAGTYNVNLLLREYSERGFIVTVTKEGEAAGTELDLISNQTKVAKLPNNETDLTKTMNVGVASAAIDLEAGTYTLSFASDRASFLFAINVSSGATPTFPSEEPAEPTATSAPTATAEPQPTATATSEPTATPDVKSITIEAENALNGLKSSDNKFKYTTRAVPKAILGTSGDAIVDWTKNTDTLYYGPYDLTDMAKVGVAFQSSTGSTVINVYAADAAYAEPASETDRYPVAEEDLIAAIDTTAVTPEGDGDFKLYSADLDVEVTGTKYIYLEMTCSQGADTNTGNLDYIVFSGEAEEEAPATPAPTATPVTKAEAASYDELIAALAVDTVEEIIVTNSFTANSAVTINRDSQSPVKIYAEGDVKTITVSSDKDGVVVTGGNVTIENLNVELSGDADGWQGKYVMQAYDNSNPAEVPLGVTTVTLNNVKLSGGDAGLLVNGAKVTASQTLDVSGNEFGGIEISKGTGVLRNPSLALNGTVVNSDEAADKPTIWIDKYRAVFAEDHSMVTGTTELPYAAENTEKDQFFFYLNNYETPVEPETGFTLDLTDAALGNVENGGTVAGLAATIGTQAEGDISVVEYDGAKAIEIKDAANGQNSVTWTPDEAISSGKVTLTLDFVSKANSSATDTNFLRVNGKNIYFQTKINSKKTKFYFGATNSDTKKTLSKDTPYKLVTVLDYDNSKVETTVYSGDTVVTSASSPAEFAFADDIANLSSVIVAQTGGGYTEGNTGTDILVTGFTAEVEPTQAAE